MKITSTGAFFVRDDHYTTIPLIIDQQSPTDSVHITSNGVGFGTSTPGKNIELYGVDPVFRFHTTNSSRVWDLNAMGNDFVFSSFDGTSTRAPFSFGWNTPDDTLRLDYNGNVGFGTVSPQQPLHLYTPDTSPILRFEEATGTPHTWDLVADHLGFDLVDVTSGNTTPFTILPGAQSNSLFVAANGSVGLGTASPVTRLHAHQSSASGTAETLARFEVSDDANSRLDINNATSTDGSFIPRIQGRSGSSVAALITEGVITDDTGGSPVIVYNAAKVSGGAVATRPLVVYRNNNAAMVTVAANGNVTATSFINASSRELKDDISDLDSAKASAALRQLTPVEFTYKDDATREPRVGFIAEDVPDLIAEPERKSVPVMDVVAVLTRVVKDQQQTIDDLTKRLAALEGQRNAGE